MEADCATLVDECSLQVLDYFEWGASFVTTQSTQQEQTVWSSDDEYLLPSLSHQHTHVHHCPSSGTSSPLTPELTVPSSPLNLSSDSLPSSPERNHPLTPPQHPLLYQQQQQPSPPTTPPPIEQRTLTPPPIVAPIRSDKFPEFLYATPDLSSLTASDFTNSFQYTQPFHRNCYEVVKLKVPTFYDGYRVYITPKLGYSGNAKRFKHAPDVGERALILDGELLDCNMRPITQCQTCEEYFKDSQKWVLLIKNNLPKYVTQGEFALQMKLMCCSPHHNNSLFYFRLTLFDVLENQTKLTSLFTANVKQWKNMSTASAMSVNKRKKPEPP